MNLQQELDHYFSDLERQDEFSGMIRYFPDQDICAVVLSNMEEGAWSPIWKIHELLVNEEIERG